MSSRRGARAMLDSDSDSSDDKEEQYDFKRKKPKDEDSNDSKRIVYDVNVKQNTASVPIKINATNTYSNKGYNLPCHNNNNNKRLCVEEKAERRRRFEADNKNFVKPTVPSEKQVITQTKTSIGDTPLPPKQERIKKPIDILTKNKIHLNGTKHQTHEIPIKTEKISAEMDEAITMILKDWKWTTHKLKIDDDISWIPPKASTLDPKTLISGLQIGPLVPATQDDKQFCNPKLLEKLFELKTLLGKMKDADIKDARSRSNPFESLKNGLFLNRAAMKMANIDAMLGFALTEPKTQTGEPALGPNDLLYFADICSGPGGFTEYILWRKKWDAKGFGFTLKGELDFQFTEFFSGPPESFEAYYGPADDGNIYNPNNFRGFVKHVLSNTEGRGVHFLMADGGFSVRGQENDQEKLSQHICLSQVLYAVGLIRAGGHFVCKLFDAFTPFTIGLLYLLYNCFDLVSIIKPVTSRPANSERYVVCKWKRDRERIMPIIDFLAKCHEIMWDASNNKIPNTVIEVVPLEVLKTDETFFKYIWDSNNTIAERQVENLKRILAFNRDPNLKAEIDEEMKAKCLDLWKLPESIKKMLSLGPDPKFKSLCVPYNEGFVNNCEKELTVDLIKTIFKSPYDWRCVAVEGSRNSSYRGFYLALGGMKNYVHKNNEWVKVDIPFSMCKDSVVYGEIVREWKAEACNSNAVSVFHIIDGMILGGKDIRSLHYTQRHEMCVKFAKAMNSSTSNHMAVSVKNPIRMENIGDLIERLRYKFIKDAAMSTSSLVAHTDHTDETSSVIRPAGLLLLKITKDPWLMSCSRSARRKYWFNTVSGESTFAVVEGAIADFLFTMDNRVIWWWDRNMKLNATGPSSDKLVSANASTDKGTIHVYHIMEHINSVITHK